MKLKKTLLLSIPALILAIGLSSCNTIQGAGQDIEAAGRGLENAANQ